MIGCVDVPALALQLVMRAHPEWDGEPVVVVEDDRPLAPIVWANRAARAHKIRRGQSFAQAKALSAKLHAEVVPESALEAAIDQLFDLLVPFSPGVEPVLPQPGLFWLDPSGLSLLFGDLQRWAERIHAKLASAGFIASVVVGFVRPRVYAIARVTHGTYVVRDAGEEQRLAEQVPLDRLGISPNLRDALALLALHTVGDLLALPVAALRTRYGEEVARLHDYLNGRTWTPLLPRIPTEPLRLTLDVDPPDDDSTRLLFGLKQVLHTAATQLAGQHQAITTLHLTLDLDRPSSFSPAPSSVPVPKPVPGPALPPSLHERIETAAPTLDIPQLVDLLRLRLATVTLPARVERVSLELEHTRVHRRQLELCHGKRARDLEAAARAIARLRASLGPDAVTRARLCDAHLPEAAYRYEPTRELKLPAPRSPRAELPLVRRIFSAPRPLPAMPVHEPEAWLGHHGALCAMFGPYRVTSGWWSQSAHERDYHFVETRTGEVLWLFYDRIARRWFLQGVVD